MSTIVNAIQSKIEELNSRFKNLSAEEVLAFFINEYKNKIALASSMGAEDQVLTKMVNDINPSIKIFTLDTGRLFPESYQLMEETNRFFKTSIDVYFPDFRLTQKMVAEKGINLFYLSIENRKECCHIRKIEPLKRAFAGLDVWICGLRREQSVTRLGSQMVEWDQANGLIKLNPLINWTENEVWDYIKQYKIPYNSLHDQGFPSIGCQPCTRAIKLGEDVRAGRWWWEEPEHKECGLHNRPQNK